jgi:hypothetical protein
MIHVLIITITLALALPAGAWADGIGGVQSLNFSQIGADLGALADLAALAAGVIGFFLLGSGLIVFVSRKGRQQSIGRPMMMILVGGVLLSISSAMNVAAGSLFGGDNLTFVGLDGHVSDAAGSAAPMFALLLRISWIVGFLGFIHGWHGLTRERPETGVCIAKILGGSCAMNLPVMVQAMASWGGVFAGLATYIH